MGRSKCPKCRLPAYRLYAETTSPVTHRSTKVTVAAVICATLSTAIVGGRTVGIYRVKTGQHGVVGLDPYAFAMSRRQSINAVNRSHPDWIVAAKPKTTKPKTKPKTKTPAGKHPAKAPPKAPPKARATTGKARKPSKAPTPVPATSEAQAGSGGPSEEAPFIPADARANPTE